MDLSARASGRADHHGDAQAVSVSDNQLQIFEHGRVTDNCHAFSQLMGSGVGTSGIHDDSIRLLLDSPQKGLFGEAIPQNAAGGENLHLLHIACTFPPWFNFHQHITVFTKVNNFLYEKHSIIFYEISFV